MPDGKDPFRQPRFLNPFALSSTCPLPESTTLPNTGTDLIPAETSKECSNRNRKRNA